MNLSSKSALKTSISFCVAVLLFLSCKKDTTPLTPPPPPPPPPPSPCKLTDEDKNYGSGYEHYWYTYTSDGKLDSIYYSQVPGGRNNYVAYCKEDPEGFVWYTYQNTNGLKPNQFDFLYTGGFTDSSNLPRSLSTSFQVFNDPNMPGYGYDFQYKASGRLDGYAQTAAFITGALEGMGVEYSDSGDVTSLDYNTITGPRGHNQILASGYDGHPTPWAGLVGWVFRTPATQWISLEYDQVLFTLSDHNPTSSSYSDNNGVIQQRETVTYEYNDRMQPTKRTILRTFTAGGSDTFTDDYAYDCK